MRVMAALVVAIATAGCMDGAASPPPPIDSGPPPVVDPSPGCPALPDPFPFDLGPCVPDSNPQVNVLCGPDDSGWCIAGTCRPMGIDGPSGCPVCPTGTERFSSGGGRYCAPPG